MTDTIRSELRRKFGKKYKCRNNTAKIIICILLVFCVAILLLSALYIEKKVSPFMKQEGPRCSRTSAPTGAGSLLKG